MPDRQILSIELHTADYFQKTKALRAKPSLAWLLPLIVGAVVVLAVGGTYAMLPRFLPRHAHESTTEAPTPGQSKQPDPSQQATGGLRPVSREAQEAEAKP